jgi:hypothetical protein
VTGPVSTSPRSASARAAKIDEICAAAVDLARASITEDVAGDYVEAVAEGDRIVTHYFESNLAGYRGWRWAVVVTRTPRSKQVTVSETVLLPGPDALTPPEWVPWEERVRPGDLGVGDLMPTAPDDDRLVPGYLLSDDPAVEDVVWEIGLGRVRVLSRDGRLDAADRWYEGDHGPHAAITQAAPPAARCVTCGFYLPLAGAMRQAFGVCANLYAPDDGQVVSVDHGCGAHSEVLIDAAPEVDEAPTIFDDSEVVDVEVHAAEAVAPEAESVPAVDADLAEAADDSDVDEESDSAADQALASEVDVDREPVEPTAEATEAVVAAMDVPGSAAEAELATPEPEPTAEVFETPTEMGAPESAESTDIVAND